MKALLIGMMLLHGVAHAVGFAGAWQLASNVPYKTTILFGRLDLGDAGIRIIGLLWLFIGIAFVLAAIAAWSEYKYWITVAGSVAVLSSALCLVELPQARFGIVVNLFIVLVMTIGTKFEWLA